MMPHEMTDAELRDQVERTDSFIEQVRDAIRQMLEFRHLRHQARGVEREEAGR